MRVIDTKQQLPEIRNYLIKNTPAKSNKLAITALVQAPERNITREEHNKR